MKQITAFMASDGSLHADSNACVNHELTLSLKPLMKEFFDQETRYTQSTRVGYTKLLVRWEAFKLRQSQETPESDSNVE